MIYITRKLIFCWCHLSFKRHAWVVKMVSIVCWILKYMTYSQCPGNTQNIKVRYVFEITKPIIYPCHRVLSFDTYICVSTFCISCVLWRWLCKTVFSCGLTQSRPIFNFHSGVPYYQFCCNIVRWIRQTSNTSRSSVGNKLAGHSYVVGASPIGMLQLHLPSRLNTWL